MRVLADALVVATVAVTDLDRANTSLQEQLGLRLLDETPFALRFGAGSGTRCPCGADSRTSARPPPISRSTTSTPVMQELTSRGVTFEEYETPKTINFIAQVGPARGAWFQDPDGNVFGLRRRAGARRGRRVNGSDRNAQQTKTNQHSSLRSRWSSRTSSRMALGSWARCHRHSWRPASSRVPSVDAARAALIA